MVVDSILFYVEQNLIYILEFKPLESSIRKNTMLNFATQHTDIKLKIELCKNSLYSKKNHNLYPIIQIPLLNIYVKFSPNHNPKRYLQTITSNILFVYSHCDTKSRTRHPLTAPLFLWRPLMGTRIYFIVVR